MKKFKLFKLLALFVVLIASINTAWAGYTVQNEVKLYVDNSASEWTYSYRYVALGWEDNGSAGGYSLFGLSEISNTKLLVYQRGSDYGNCYDLCLFGATGDWGANGGTYDNMKQYGANVTQRYALTGALSYQASYLIVPAGAGSKSSPTAITVTQAGTGSSSYTSLNYTQTVKFAIAENGGSPAELTSGTTPATISMSSYKFTNSYNSVASESPTAWSAGSSSPYNKTFSAARTATTTVTVSNEVDGYTFLGWYSAASGGTELSTNKAYTYYPTAATTVYARFSHETTHSVDITYKCGSTTVSTATSQAIGQVTASSITAPTVTGFTFSNWTLGTGMSNQSANTSANPISVKTLSSGNYTMQANYTEDLTTSYELRGGSAFGTHPTDPWQNQHAMTKKTGHSTESVAYYTASIASTNTGEANGDFQFKIKVGDTWYGLAADGDQYYYTRAISEGGSKTQTLSSSGKNIELRADIAGNYEIKVDYSGATPTITITYPTTYTVELEVGDVKGNANTPKIYLGSVAPANIISSGSKVLAGSKVIFWVANSAAAAPASGYNWWGFYDNAAGANPTKYTNNDVSVYTINSIAADAHVYAVFGENDYVVTVQSNDATYGGTVASSSVTGHKDTKVTLPNAVAKKGYYFKEWTVTSGTATITNATNATGAQINGMTGDVTVQANFEPQWTLLGPKNWTSSDEDGFLINYNNKDTGYVTFTSLAANTPIAFKVYDRKNSKWIGTKTSQAFYYADGNGNTWKTITASAPGGDGSNLTLNTAAAGSYTFKWNQKDSAVAILYPTSYYIASGVVTEYNEGASSDATETGGTFTAVDNSSNNVKGGKFVASGASVTFTAEAKTGYQFDGWYTDEDCTEGKTMTNPLTVSSIGANVTRYAKFKEIMTMVEITTYGRGTFKVDDGSEIEETTYPHIKVGVHTTHKVTIVSEDEGYYFSGWTLSPGSSCEEADKAVNFTISGTASDEDNRTNVTITGLGDPDKCTSLNFLRANFGELEKIHFRNNFDDGTNPATHWSSVYVYFDVSLEDSRVKTSSVNTTKNLHVAMTDSEYKNRWWAYVPRWVTRNNKYKVAFADFDYAENGYKLWPGSGSSNHGHAVYRDDYRSNNNLFVPYHTPTSTSTADGTGNTDYYNDGYWMLYTIYTGVGGGYYVEERTGSGTYSGRLGELDVINKAWETQKIQYSLRVDGLSHNKFVIFNEAGHKYKASSDITYANCTDVIMTEDNDADAYFNFTPTAEGQYVITIEQEGDQMKMSVEYPVVAGDYVIENAYNDGSAKTTRSNVIKASSASTKTRYSMYLNNAGSGTLKLRKCESINASGVPQWSTGDATNLSGILSDGDFTPGVYQFDITVADDKVETIDSVRLYTGNYYIKTDAASGGWAAYKQNVLDKNTVNFDRTSATFDNYFCKYFASKDCNIKSVIANDYCNQLSDTVKGDGIARMEDGEPYVPVDGTSIRFSYNSATNETKRAYLGASERNDFLNLVEDQAAEKVYRKIDATTYDLHNITGYDNLWKTKFADNGNWVYEMALKVKPSAQAGVTAAYRDASSVEHDQVLIPSTNTVLGGSTSSENLYSIRIVYDFKTNFMMSSFVLTADEIGEDLSDFDMLWVRHKDEAATQLNLGDGKKLTNVRVVGAIELRYDSVHWQASHTGHWQDLSTWNPLSRPFMKYFVSFPFNVQVSSIFGLNQAKLGTAYVIQGYNGEKRAKEGLFLGDGDSYWEYLTAADTMKAGQGYYVIFDNDYARGYDGHIWDNKSAGSSVYMYFPAMEEIETIDNTNQTSIVPKHECKINRPWAQNAEKNHMNTDSHWNTVGSPLFHNSYINEYATAVDTPLTSYYYLDNPVYGTQPTWMVQAIKDAPMFKAMSAVLVQWAGTITWTTTEKNIFGAPRRKVADEKSYFLKLDMWYNGNLNDWTYVDLREGAKADFMLNEDMSKVNNRGVPNIYTFAGAYDVAYNSLPVENQTVPVGMIIRKNGTYTFSMPYNFSGTVTLIDNFAQTRTNLNMENYEVYLNKGTINDRFELEINIHKVPTAIDGVTDGQGSLKDGKAHKFIMNDQMYILKDGVLYDARGARVK